MPKETDTGFDPRKDAPRHGPWMVDKSGSLRSRSITSATRITSLRIEPFLDGWTNYIVKEYAQQLAQFKTGAIWGGVATQQDVLTDQAGRPTSVRDLPERVHGHRPGPFFGWNSAPQYKDVRVRQAILS